MSGGEIGKEKGDGFMIQLRTFLLALACLLVPGYPALAEELGAPDKRIVQALLKAVQHIRSHPDEVWPGYDLF